MMTWRRTFSEGVSWPAASVKSSPRIADFLIASACDTALLALSMAAWISARKAGSPRRSATAAVGGLSLSAFHWASISGSTATSVPMYPTWLNLASVFHADSADT